MPSSRPTTEEIVDYIKNTFAVATAIGANDLVLAPGVGFKIVVYGYSLNALSGVNTAQLGQGLGIPITSNKALADKNSFIVPPSTFPLCECSENTKLVVMLGSATGVGVDVQYMIQRV